MSNQTSEVKTILIICLAWLVITFAIAGACSNQSKKQKDSLTNWNSKVTESKPTLPPSESEIIAAVRAEYKTDSRLTVILDDDAGWATNAFNRPGSEIEWTYIGINVDADKYTYGQEAIVSTHGQQYDGFYDKNIAVVIEKQMTYSVKSLPGGNKISYSYPVYKCRLKSGGNVDELELTPFHMMPTR